MTTTEDRITQDLAMVGRMSLVRPTPVEVTLRAVGAVAGVAASELALVVLARVFVGRVARTAAGIVSLTCLAAMVASLAVPRLAGWLERDAHRGIAVELLEARGSWIGLFVVAAALSAYVGASGIATRVFERAAARARDPLHAARRLVHRADGWATGASIAGLATPVVGFGMIEVAVGHSGLLALFAHADGIAAIRHLTLGSLRGAFAAIVAGAVIVAWYSDARWLRRTAWTVPAGLVLAFVTCLIGARLDVGPLVVTIAGGARPSPAMRIALTATGTVAVFLATAGLVLRTRRREAAAIARAAGSAQPVR